MDIQQEKQRFKMRLKEFAASLGNFIATDNEWNIRGFIDIFKNVYTVSSDTKIVSKVMELHLFSHFLTFADANGYDIELATHQNWYPDLTFILREDKSVKFAVDLKTTYRDRKNKEYCNGFTLGSHGKYFIDRTSKKNIQYPYSDYSGHFCLGIIYSRLDIDKKEELKVYTVDKVESIPAVISDFTFFAEEKWKIASDKSGSGNTGNIGSIKNIENILNGNGVFAKAGEEIFDDYWANYGKLEIPIGKGKTKKLSSLPELLLYKNLPGDLYNENAERRKK